MAKTTCQKCPIRNELVSFLDCPGCKHMNSYRYATEDFPCDYPEIPEEFVSMGYNPVWGDKLTETELKGVRVWVK